MIIEIIMKNGDVIIPKENEFFEELPKSVRLYERIGSIHDKIVTHWRLKSWHKKSISKIERKMTNVP